MSEVDSKNVCCVTTGLTIALAKQIKNSSFSFYFMLVSEVTFDMTLIWQPLSRTTSVSQYQSVHSGFYWR